MVLANIVEHALRALGLGQMRSAAPMAAVSIALGKVMPHGILRGITLRLRLSASLLFSVGAMRAIASRAKIIHRASPAAAQTGQGQVPACG